MTWNERKFVNDVLAQNVKDVLAQNVNDVMLDRACAPYRLCISRLPGLQLLRIGLFTKDYSMRGRFFSSQERGCSSMPLVFSTN